jgi:hypothetical protein
MARFFHVRRRTSLSGVLLCRSLAVDAVRAAAGSIISEFRGRAATACGTHRGARRIGKPINDIQGQNSS